jgi:flotillin
MAKKADAWKEYKEAAMLDMILEALPKIAAEVAAPLSQAKKITMIADGSGEIGAAKLTAEVLAIIASVPQAVKNMTGVDITATLARGGMGASRVRIFFCY